MRARPLVWITLAAALLCAVFAFVRMENLPKDPISGEMTAVIAQVSDDRLLLREVMVDGQPVRGGVMLYSEPCGCLMQEGMTIRMHTTLQPLEEETNPHGWSDKTWFAAKGVVYTCEGAVDAHSETAPYSLRGDLRSRMRSHIEELWPKEKEILTALLLGYDELLSDETMEVFRRSGAAHLLAVSGLHVGFVATLALMLFGWLRKGSVGRMLTVLACLGAYALVAESAFSVFRAVMMLAMVLCAQCCGRRADGATSLALAALAALAAEPMEIVRAGFLMSVCAVAGIFMLCSRIDRALEKILPVRRLRSGIAVSLSAQLGVLPVQACLFGTVNVLSLLTNLFAVPLAGGIVMLGLPAVLLHMLLPAAAEIPAAVVGFMARLLVTVCETVAGLRFAVVQVEAPPVLVLLGYLGVLFLCSPYFAEFGKKARVVWAAVILCGVAAGLALWLPGVCAEEKDRAVFLSVGTADCAVLETEQGAVLIDTGWSGSRAVRYAQGEGIAFHAVILTHADGDHAGGLQNVLENVPVGAVYVPKGMRWEGLETAYAVAQEKKIPVVELTRGDKMTVGAYELTVLSPTHVRAGEENADSLVLQADRGDTTLLMMGDVTAAEEAALALPDCDILKIPHHGSGTASSALLLEKTTPADAVISVGTPNRYGFPKADVLQRLEEANVSIWRTDEAGAVTVTFAEEGYTIKGYAPKTRMEKLFGVRGE